MTIGYTAEELKWIYIDNGIHFKDGCPEEIKSSVNQKREFTEKHYERIRQLERERKKRRDNEYIRHKTD